MLSNLGKFVKHMILQSQLSLKNIIFLHLRLKSIMICIIFIKSNLMIEKWNNKNFFGFHDFMFY